MTVASKNFKNALDWITVESDSSVLDLFWHTDSDPHRTVSRLYLSSGSKVILGDATGAEVKVNI